AELSAPFDSVSICFSKGLGTPIGSVLVGTKKFIQRAHRWRKMLGGGMRQAGIVAAAMDHALDHHIERLADDHAHAELLHDGLAELATQHADLQVEPAQTNMVYVNFANLEAAQKVSDYLRENGVLTARSQRMRLVTHLNISHSDVEQVLTLFKQALARV